MFSVLIVDPATLIRYGLKQVLKAEWGLTTIGEAPTVDVAREQFRKRRWKIVVLGLPPFEQDLRLIGEIKQDLPSTKIMLMGRDPKAVARAVHAGACGFLRSDASVTEIVRAFSRIFTGQPHRRKTG